MLSNKTAREKLLRVIEEEGIKLKHVSKKAGVDYYNLVRFKNGKLDYGEGSLNKLMRFMSKYE